MRIEKNSPVIGSLASRVVLPCHFSMIPHTPSSTTPAPTLGSLHTTPGPGDDLRIKWTKLEAQGEKVVLVAQNGLVKMGQEYAGRVSVPSHPLSVRDASLIIARVRTSDAGLYSCEVMHGMEDSRDTVSLDVTGEENKHTLTRSQFCTFIGTIKSYFPSLHTCSVTGSRCVWIAFPVFINPNKQLSHIQQLRSKSKQTMSEPPCRDRLG